MPDTKITALAAITTVDPAADVLPIVDISDTSMAASGTTKKITSNQILGAGGTATLASATITGDLTVDTSTLKVDSTNNRVGIGTASPSYDLEIAGAVRSSLAIRGNFAGGTDIAHLRFVNANGSVVGDIFSQNTNGGASDSAYLSFITASSGTSSERYRIAADGVATWSNVGGVAGTAMTLNATGLGVGASPSLTGGSRRTLTVNAPTGQLSILELGINGSIAGYLFSNATQTTLAAVGATFFSVETNAAERLRVDASGNLLVGTTSPLSSVSGSSQIALGGAGLQTTSQAISAATATTICRSGSGGVAIVAGYNGTGQYSAIIIFSYGAGGGVTVVSSQNNTGSTITYALSGVNVQITSSLALTNLTTTCIRTA